MYTKTIVVLAKSYKQGGWCIAGREINLDLKANTFDVSGGWVRPVSDDNAHHGALLDMHCAFADGSTPRIYDIVEVELQCPAPEIGQPENHSLTGKAWNRINDITPDAIHAFSEDVPDIWLEDQSNNYVTDVYAQFGNVSSSLVIIRPSDFQIHLSNNLNEYTGEFKKETRGAFTYKGVRYTDISITDPAIRKMLRNQYPAQGYPEIVTTLNAGDNCYLCCSLAPAWGGNNRHYKLIATVFDFDGYIQRTYG